MSENDAQLDTSSPPGWAARLAFNWQKTPGFRPGGRLADPPADFASVDADPVAWIESRATLPYVIALGYLGLGEAVYVVALPHSTWFARLQRNPNVRLRIGKSVYAMHAIPVEDDEELRRMLERYNAKYVDWIAQYYGDSPYTIENVRNRVVPLRLAKRQRG